MRKPAKTRIIKAKPAPKLKRRSVRRLVTQIDLLCPYCNRYWTPAQPPQPRLRNCPHPRCRARQYRAKIKATQPGEG